MAIDQIIYRNYNAVKLSFNQYSVIILNGRGCNIIEFVDNISGYSFLHFPEDNELSEFISSPQRFGSALLFPPNRIANGHFTKNGITYDYNSCNLPSSHGILKELPFSVVETQSTTDFEYIKFKLSSRETAYFSAFHWDFDCIFEYILSEDGLTQNITFINNGSIPIPFGAGFHTAFRIPFAPDSTADDYNILVTADYQWELDKYSCPTGAKSTPDHDYLNGNVFPLKTSIAEHLHSISHSNTGNTSIPNFHGAIVTNNKNKTRIIYETDPKFAHWMIWNNKASDNYICIEPMSWIINAPNTNLPDSETGFTYLEPGKHWTAKNKLWIES